MSRKTNIINTLITFAITFGALFAVSYVCNARYFIDGIFSVALWLILGAIIAGIFNTFVHELGHLIVGKLNKFVFSSMQILFFKWQKMGGKICFSFAPIVSEAGYTEMIPTTTENINKRYRRMSLAGPFASLIFAFVGIVPLFIKGLSEEVFCLWVMFLPIGLYFHFSSVLPTSSCGFRNDGGVAYGLRVMDNVSIVTLALLKVQAEMYLGKTPSEIDEEYYFNLPQLPEDDPAFMMLLNAQYNYFLDKGDYVNAKKTISRLSSLEEYMPKHFLHVVKSDLLYNYCTFDYNEDLADDLMYELEKYLNNVNTATTIRVKTAYLLYVKHERERLDMFFIKGLKEADKAPIKGYGAFERKLIEKMKADL